jgi:acetylglutamate kinase
MTATSVKRRKSPSVSTSAISAGPAIATTPDGMVERRPSLPIRVIKLGGRAQSDARLADVIAAASGASRLCVVHGGGDEVSAMQRQLGLTPVFSHGRRKTSAADAAVVRMVLSGAVNKKLVACLVAAGVPAFGLSGEDAGLMSASPLGVEEFGYVGMPTKVNVALLDLLFGAGYVPIISPVAFHEVNEGAIPLNVNGDDAAAALAVALDADDLLFVSDVPGVLDAAGNRLDSVDIEDVAAMANNGAVSGGMSAKLEAAHAALAGGVQSVRVGNLDAITASSAGTRITFERMIV